MVHHIELPNLGEEPSNSFITVLSEANGTSPTSQTGLPWSSPPA